MTLLLTENGYYISKIHWNDPYRSYLFWRVGGHFDFAYPNLWDWEYSKIQDRKLLAESLNIGVDYLPQHIMEYIEFPLQLEII